jgi:hypothetical protein
MYEFINLTVLRADRRAVVLRKPQYRALWVFVGAGADPADVSGAGSTPTPRL